MQGNAQMPSITYDFVEDVADNAGILNEYLEAGDSLGKYVFYKSSKRELDPDSHSQLLQKLYEAVWPDLCQQDFMRPLSHNSSKEIICSDTMTSAQASINSLMKAIDDKAEANGERCPFRDLSGCWTGSQRHYSEHFFLMVYGRSEESIRKQFDSYGGQAFGVGDFLASYHTIGNYSPVPRGFNSPRSNFGKHDCWDLTLMKVKQYFDSERTNEAYTEIIAECLLHSHKSRDDHACKNWLDYFGGDEAWRRFIETYYFQDYVKDFDGGDLDVSPFCEGHCWETPEITDFPAFFDSACMRIIRRGKRILSAIEPD